MSRKSNLMRFASCAAWSLLVGCGGDAGPYFIHGTARLPSCTEAPALTLASSWFDQGTVEVTSAGCDDARPGERYTVCPLDWAVSQQGNDVAITVDSEYELKGRFCGETLHLEGGWWLPVRDEAEGCTYEEDSASEVLIQREGNALKLGDPVQGAPPTFRGTLSLGGSCTGRYEMTLTPAVGTSGPEQR